jgi:hypothetical protein
MSDLIIHPRGQSVCVIGILQALLRRLNFERAFRRLLLFDYSLEPLGLLLNSIILAIRAKHVALAHHLALEP